eukprot:TRINITY_DN6798_c0_g1_i1.p1 TRINITY_DN6798_c0_g1~~TRINITY_DN6798_c0_g1_i1.p1  ORF type:complete len:689 (+),score=154.85 TRINITY_DN6798_c0_g1_i1:1-2067(+)
MTPLPWEEFLVRWSLSDPQDKLRGDLLQRVLKQNVLKQEALQDKRRLIIVMKEALHSFTPHVYENAIILAAEMIDKKNINLDDLNEMDGMWAAINSLKPKQIGQTDSYCATKHIAALVYLACLDDYNLPWPMTISQSLTKIGGLPVIVEYVGQNQSEKPKLCACKVLGMMIQNGQLISELFKLNVIPQLVSCLRYHDVDVQVFAAETLWFLLKDNRSKPYLPPVSADIVTMVDALVKATDHELISNLIMCFVHLTPFSIARRALMDNPEIPKKLYSVLADLSLSDCHSRVYTLLTALASTPDIKADFYKNIHIYLELHVCDEDPRKKKNALLCMKKLIEDKSTFEYDFDILPSLLKNCKIEEDDLIVKYTLQIILTLCLRHPQSIVEQLKEKNGIPLIVSLYMNDEDIEAVKLSGDIILLLSVNALFIKSVNETGGDSFIIGLVDNLGDYDADIVENAAYILKNLTRDMAIHKAFNDENDMANVVALITRRPGTELDRKLIEAGLDILVNLTQNMELCESLRMNNIVTTMVDMIISEFFPPDLKMKILRVLKQMLCGESSYDYMYDLLTDPDGVNNLLDILDPPDRDNPLALESVPIWEELILWADKPEFAAAVNQDKELFIGDFAKFAAEAEIPEINRIMNLILNKLLQMPEFEETVLKIKEEHNRQRGGEPEDEGIEMQSESTYHH